MHELIVDVLVIDRVVGARQPQVALWEEVNILLLSKQHPHSDVEFALVNQQRLLDILLDDETIKFDAWFAGSVAPILQV